MTIITGYGLGEYDNVINISTLEKFTVLKEDLTFDYCGYVFYKNSVILPVFDNFFVKIRESGLAEYYLAEVSVGFTE